MVDWYKLVGGKYSLEGGFKGTDACVDAGKYCWLGGSIVDMNLAGL